MTITHESIQMDIHIEEFVGFDSIDSHKFKGATIVLATRGSGTKP